MMKSPAFDSMKKVGISVKMSFCFLHSSAKGKSRVAAVKIGNDIQKFFSPQKMLMACT